MEPVCDPSIPLGLPNSQLNTLLTTFFDPNHTLSSIAAALGLSLEGLLNYLSIPEVAAALDEAEALIQRRAANRATAAIEQVLYQLQSLPPLPATPSEADTDRHRKNLEATRRAADLLRKTIAPSREPAGRARGQRPSLVRAAATASIPLPESSRNHEREIPRAEPSTRGRSPRSQAAISCKPPTPAAPFRLAEIAGTTSPDVYRPSAPLSPEERRALDRMAERNPDLCHQAPALFGTPYTRGQAG